MLCIVQFRKLRDQLLPPASAICVKGGERIVGEVAPAVAPRCRGLYLAASVARGVVVTFASAGNSVGIFVAFGSALVSFASVGD